MLLPVVYSLGWCGAASWSGVVAHPTTNRAISAVNIVLIFSCALQLDFPLPVRSAPGRSPGGREEGSEPRADFGALSQAASILRPTRDRRVTIKTGPRYRARGS